MKKLYQQLKGYKGNGLLLTKYQTDEGTIIRGAVLVLKKKQIASIVHANDKGWHDKSGKIYNFHRSENQLFVRQLVFVLNAVPVKKESQKRK